MEMRVSSGMVRFGLPGLVLGVALCWGTSMRGPEAASADRARGSSNLSNRIVRSDEPGAIVGWFPQSGDASSHGGRNKRDARPDHRIDHRSRAAVAVPH